MRVVVLGAGVIGTTSAWYLAQSGHEVMVVDRQPEPALETSFANGGQISVSHSEPWANPTAPLTILSRCTAASSYGNCGAIPVSATILIRGASCTCTKTTGNSNTRRDRPNCSELAAWTLKSGRHWSALRSNLRSSIR